MRFVPAVGELSSESESKLEARRQFDRVFRIEGALERTPRQRGVRQERRGERGIGAHRALEERLQIGERCLGILVLYQTVVGLQALEPHAEIQQVLSVSDADLIGRREEIARHTEIASGVRASVGELRRAVERGASANYDSARHWRSR